jgi:class 3 adenylate cyclase
MTKVIGRVNPFKPYASSPMNGIAVIYDLAGFSKFFNQPDVHMYVPIYLNYISDFVERAFFGGDAFWVKKKNLLSALSILPVHRKFLGDGALYVWSIPEAGLDSSEDFIGLLCNRLWNIQSNFEDINKSVMDKVPVYELPTHIRFGVSRGSIWELQIGDTGETEYIGICLNLASRLQKYCPGLNFIASARLGVPQQLLDKHGYIRVLATKLKGFPKEIVIVDEQEYTTLEAKVRKDLFDEI